MRGGSKGIIQLGFERSKRAQCNSFERIILDFKCTNCERAKAAFVVLLEQFFRSLLDGDDTVELSFFPCTDFPRQFTPINRLPAKAAKSARSHRQLLITSHESIFNALLKALFIELCRHVTLLCKKHWKIGSFKVEWTCYQPLTMPQARAHRRRREKNQRWCWQTFKFDLHVGTRLTFSISFSAVIAVCRPQLLHKRLLWLDVARNGKVLNQTVINSHSALLIYGSRITWRQLGFLFLFWHKSFFLSSWLLTTLSERFTLNEINWRQIAQCLCRYF